MPNDLIYIVMDSCRFDSYREAKTPNMDKLGIGEQRYSFASWTSPSHTTLLMGQVPHESPKAVFASEIYKNEFKKWVDRTGVADLSFKSFVPDLCLPKVLKDNGYRTTAKVSMPVLNPFAGFNRSFDDYELMPNHNDFAGMVEMAEFSSFQPNFYFYNLGETHYPYMLEDESLPIIHGVHGVVKGMDDQLQHGGDLPSDGGDFFSKDTMHDLHQQQIKCVEYIDGLVGALMDEAPEGAHFIITADHGELFGEDDYFGHGPIMHEKVFQVPFLEGKKR